ncbi:AMP-binding protein [Candidatus Woesebacteria bacterium]|nr:AMP-binding protein [Candidatus Woesebacteria bacterium]
MSKSRLYECNTITDLVLASATTYHGRIAFEIRRRIIRERVYFQDIPTHARSVIHLLKSHGVKPGDKVLIWGLNCPEYSVILLSLFLYGIVAVPIDFRTSPEIIESIIGQTNPAAIFISRMLDESKLHTKISAQFIIEDLLARAKPVSDTVEPFPLCTDPNSLCEIVYTSGTTGVPKGVMISQKNIISNLKAIYPIIPDKHIHHHTISILPLSHMLEQVIGLFVAMTIGSSVTYMTRVNTYRLRKAMVDVRPTYLVFVPQLLALFWARIEEEARNRGKFQTLTTALVISKYVPSQIRRLLFRNIHAVFGGRLRFIGCGGAPLNYHIGNNFVHMGFRILEGYGATEVTAMASANNGEFGVGNVGKPVEGVQIKLDENGQILIKSDCISQGYYNNPEKTQEAFRNGWYHTGDIGKFAENGVLHVVGRDFFKIVLANGEKIYVEDVEKTIMKNTSIKDVCVIGVSDGTADKIHAILIPKDFTTFDEEAVMKEINTLLESKQQIMSQSIWKGNDFPRTPTLKLDRKLIKKILFESDNSKEQIEHLMPKVAEYLDLKSILSSISKIDKTKIRDEDILASDLGLDSLDRGELVASIEEHLGVTIDAVAINSKTTVTDVSTMITEGKNTGQEMFYRTWQFTRWGELLRLIVLHLFSFPVHSYFAKLQITNKENLKHLAPGSLIVMNHQGVVDIACVWRLLGHRAIKSISIARDTLWENKWFGYAMEVVAGAVPLDQSGGAMIPFLAKTWDLLSGGRYLIMAPQGRIQRSVMQDKFKVGVGFIAQELQCPVVPIKLVGYDAVWPAPQIMFKDFRSMMPKKRATVEVIVGTPIDYSSLQTPVEIANLIEEKLLKL